MGYRLDVYEQAIKIIRNLDTEPDSVTRDDAGVLRECWTCGRIRNLLLLAIEQEGCGTDDMVRQIVCLPGFLSSKEEWHTRRVRRKNLRVYRGVDAKEDPLDGLSWTLDPDVARWFAQRRTAPGVVITAEVAALAWLDTSEHEVISAYIDRVIDVEPVSTGNIQIDWCNRPRLRPSQNIITAKPRSVTR